MYVVAEIGSAQCKFQEGDNIEVSKIEGEEGAEISLDKVLMYVNDSDIRVGKPYLDDVKVKAKILKQSLGEKVVAFKYRKRKDSATKKGYRKKLTSLKITKISG